MEIGIVFVSWLENKYKSDNLVSVVISIGIMPVNKFDCNCKSSNFCKLLNWVEIELVKLFKSSCNVDNFVRFVISIDMEPLKKFEYNWRSTKWVKSPNSVGILPNRILSDKLRNSKFDPLGCVRGVILVFWFSYTWIFCSICEILILPQYLNSKATDVGAKISRRFF